MSKKIIYVLTLCCLATSIAYSAVTIIPKPVDLTETGGVFNLSSSVEILYEQGNTDVQEVAMYLKDQLDASTGYNLTVNSSTSQTPVPGAILLTTLGSDPGVGDEGYTMTVATDSVIIQGPQAAGIFYGVQSLRQLLPPEILNATVVANPPAWEAPCVQITDYPRFSWRGMHLDPCRHFMNKEFVKKYIDTMALHKMNSFHWHLTEDQGWRIEILQYPLLTQIGAWRYCPDMYGGYYNQTEVQEIVEYARQRYVRVVPEIEMPGHALAALAAYPEYSCTGGPFDVACNWGVFDDIYCAGKDATFTFLENILTEVMSLFPGEYIHIGGDEAPKTRWEQCPDCQQRISTEGLANEEELQTYFINRIGAFLSANNRKLVGWSEILNGGMPNDATIMSWLGASAAITAVQSGYDAIMTPYSDTYFDIAQSDDPDEPEAINYGFITALDKVYNFEPMPTGLTPEEEAHLIGSQGQVWSEYILDEDHAGYMALPRECALAEVVWTPQNDRSWTDFETRMATNYWRLAYIDINCRIPFPAIVGNQTDFTDQITIELQEPTDVLGPCTYYTLDGSAPTENSNLYTSPFVLTESAILKTRTVLANGRTSKTVSRYFNNLNDPGTITTGLAAYWPMDEDSGSVISDLSPCSNDAEVSGPTWTTGKIGAALDFSAAGDLVNIDTTDIPASWSAAMWVKARSSIASSTTLMESGAYALKLDQWSYTGKVGFTERGVSDYTFNYSAPLDTWSYLVFVGTDSDTSLWANGQFVETINSSIRCPMTSMSSTVDPLNTVLDEVAVWYRALNQNDIDYLYNNGNGNPVIGPPDTTPPTPDPMTWATVPNATGSSSIVMVATTATDPSGVEYYFTCTAGGGNDSDWQDSTSYTDTGLTPEATYTYTVTARDKSVNQNSTAASTAEPATTGPEGDVDDVANGQIPVAGTVNGTYSDTQTSNNGYESITEIESGGKPANRYSYLEHKWTINVTGGSTVTFFVEAYQSTSSDGDNFVFAYSTNDSTYTDMVTVTKTSDDNNTQSYALPSSTSGTVYIRVKDTDQTSGNRNLDTINIDHLFIRSAAGGEPDTAPPTPDPATFASPPAPVSDTEITMTATTGSDATGPVEYYFDETSLNLGGTDSGWVTNPVYNDTELSPSTQYTYTVQMRDSVTPTPNVGTASTPANATTNGSCSPTDMHIEAVVCAEISCGGPNRNGQATVTIYDNCGDPVQNALVDGTFTGDFSETFYDVQTDQYGDAVFTTAGCIRRPAFTFTVTDVTDSLPYDSNDDVTDNCSG
jgi:hexosaminidase